MIRWSVNNNEAPRWSRMTNMMILQLCVSSWSC